MSRATLLGRSLALAVGLWIATAATAGDELIVNGDFELIEKSKQLRDDNKGQDWSETRKDTDEGRKLLMLSTKKIGGNATRKAMIKGHPDLNTYLTQRFAEEQKKDFTVRYDIYVKKIWEDDNRSAFCLIGTNSDQKRGPSSTGKERFVFLGFENAGTAGRINLFAREGGNSWDEKTIVAANLDLQKWYTIELNIYVKDKEYQVAVVGVSKEPMALEAFKSRGKTPSKLTHISFASWNDGAGTFYVDNVFARKD